MASIHAQKNRAGNTYRVLWRQDGRQRSLTFENLPAAERFKTLLEDHGPDEALRIIELDEIGRHVPTVTEWLHAHIDNLTGVQPATIARYRAYVVRDIDPMFGSVPVSAVTETTIAKWVKQLGGSGKTIANKHGFLSGALNAAVRAGVLTSNPCQGRRLHPTNRRSAEVSAIRDRDEQAIRKYLDKLDPNAANRRIVEQRTPTIVAQQRRVPGKPQPADEFLAEYQEHNRKRRERIPGPLWVFWAPDPKDIFRWRIQLDCGCVEERIKALTERRRQADQYHRHGIRLGPAVTGTVATGGVPVQRQAPKASQAAASVTA